MQMVNNMAGSAAGTGAAAAAGTVSAASSGVQANAGFGQLLVQVLGGTPAGTSTAGALPDLTQLFAGLLAVAAEGEDAAVPEGINPEALKQLLDNIAEQPELLDQLLGTEDMQEWLLQASMLLQAMQLLPETGAEQAAGNAEPINLQQAQRILGAFAEASSQAGGNVFVEQLQEKLAAIVARQSNPAVQTEANAEKKDAVRKADVKPADVPEWVGKVHTTSTVSAISRLEMLAAKTLPVNRLELLTGQTGETGAEAVKTTGTHDEAEVPFSVPQEMNRMVPHKTMLPSEAVVKADTLVEDMGQFILGKLRLQRGNGMTEARLTLNPESLGQVEVKLSMQNGMLVAQFAAHTSMGKDMLESQLAQLRIALQNQGIQVEKLEVTHSPSLQSGMFQDQRQQQQSQQFNGKNQSDRKNDGNEEYALEASAILNGRTDPEKDGFDVTA